MVLLPWRTVPEAVVLLLFLSWRMTCTLLDHLALLWFTCLNQWESANEGSNEAAGGEASGPPLRGQNDRRV
jgi:hypothetical protein